MKKKALHLFFLRASASVYRNFSDEPQIANSMLSVHVPNHRDLLQTISGLIFQIDLPKSSLDDEVLLMKIAGTGEVEAIKTFFTSAEKGRYPDALTASIYGTPF